MQYKLTNEMLSCLMIRCIIPNTINMQEFFYNLQHYIKKYFPSATINLRKNKPYWKEPECNEIIYQLFNNQFITVTEFIKYLPLSWHHKKFNFEEKAIWSQLCHPEEIFLMPEIEWVHIYTWEEEQKNHEIIN